SLSRELAMPGILSHATVAGATLVITFASTAAAQTPDTARKPVPLGAVTITATRSARSTFDTPQPISVLDASLFREKLPHGAVDLLRDLAGVDVSGVGPNQRRPEIRGLGGQRILLLQDGLRLNNARRQQDFGELPALAGISSVDRVEVVRGPSSVLYGTDAIGGVVNLISRDVPGRSTDGQIRGEINFRYGSAGDAQTPSGTVAARFGRFGFSSTASYRDAGDYRAPKGRFGNVNLDESVIVNDSRVRDREYRVALGYDFSPTSEVFTRAEFYSAEHAGFGFVDPAILGPNEPTIQILYPDQDYWRYTLGYRTALATPFANRAELTTYAQRNERHLRINVFVPVSPTANVNSNSLNFTDLKTVGGRLELAKTIGSRLLLTYGADVFRDKSEGTDSSRTVVTGFGPPSARSTNAPTIPNATFRSTGAFAQLELHPMERLTTVLGTRWQDVVAETRPTPRITRPLVRSHDQTGVWSANMLYRVFSDLNAVASVGRGFRSPNLVERFFEGTVPEGGGFQKANISLGAETSINVDLGLRHRRGAWYSEGFVFRNEIDNAINAVATGDSVNRQPAFQSRNVGRLRLEGVEVSSGARFVSALDASVSFTRLKGRNVSDPGSPVGDSYSSKVVGEVTFRPAGDRFMVGYTLRHQGEQKDVIIGSNPIGAVIPAFTVHSARASLRLFDARGFSNRLSLSAENLGNKLYAEFPNASFFRPEPRRSVSLALSVGF
ncbi:MAG: TonB-dependent receptor plug domain-containing protein, partial [Gemmatimonadaceae bacterium]